MSSLYLFNLASQHNQWLSARQSLIAGNIANVNTPGFKALDLEPFEMVLENTKLQMEATKPGHLAAEQSVAGSATSSKSATWDIFNSGNDVSVEQELLKAGEVNRAYSLNTSLLKTFNHMLISSTKGG
jgi:flagellar basal-body rod protein FlgB